MELNRAMKNIEKLKEKKDYYKQETAELEGVQVKLAAKIKQMNSSNVQLKRKINAAIERPGSRGESAGVCEIDIEEEFEFLVHENEELREAVEESVKKYAAQAILNNELKLEIKQRDMTVEK